MSTTAQKVAQVLLDIKAVGFVLESPITFKSGIKSPVYVDNRKLPFYPKAWKKVLRGWTQLIEEKKLSFDIIAGIESAGIPHSAALGLLLKTPSIFVRKKTKAHGTKSRVEGGEVAGRKVLLIEDHITTGGSSLGGVAALSQSGAKAKDCLSITSYNFPEAKKNFKEAKVRLHTLTTFPILLKEAVKRDLISKKESVNIKKWLADPHHWQPSK